ncbi:hypothetical protein SNE40_004740 [Patella caerulea]|uniref:VWFC domain-containing protein n=1 Tax=Patella caerulea TaxID=87958 RepID=A0AAN8KA77_PATCE
MIGVIGIALVGIVGGAAVTNPILTTAMPKGCMHNGKMYKDGEKTTSNPCSPCFCNSGFMACLAIDCMMPNCVDPVRKPDQCCSTCPNGANCYLPDGSTILKDGDAQKMADGSTCKCASRFGFGFGPANLKARCSQIAEIKP